jgi:hypothetical protein
MNNFSKYFLFLMSMFLSSQLAADSSTICVLPIISALSTANNFENLKDVHWNTVNSEQELFVENLWPNRADLDLLKNGEMRSEASRDVNVVNQFLRDNNFTIQLKDLNDSFAFYVASILKVALEWEKEGTKTTLNIPSLGNNLEVRKEFPAVKFDKKCDQNFKVYNVKNHSPLSGWAGHNEILEIKAKNGDLVYMMGEREYCASAAALYEFISFSPTSSKCANISFLNELNHWNNQCVDKNEVVYDQAIFPMVAIDQEVDIKWLEKIKACSGKQERYEVVQALQQTKFQMNEKGAKVESAVAISCLKSCCPSVPKKVLKIENAFYLWIMRPGMKTPVFAAYVDMDAWRVPME